MTADQRFSLILSGLGLLGGGMVVTLGLLIRIVTWRTRTDDRMTGVANDLTKLVEDKDKVHRELVDQMREDRRATNERLTWLERNAWPKS